MMRLAAITLLALACATPTSRGPVVVSEYCSTIHPALFEALVTAAKRWCAAGEYCVKVQREGAGVPTVCTGTDPDRPWRIGAWDGSTLYFYDTHLATGKRVKLVPTGGRCIAGHRSELHANASRLAAHELGHMLGRAHVPESSSVMHSKSSCQGGTVP